MTVTIDNSTWKNQLALLPWDIPRVFALYLCLNCVVFLLYLYLNCIVFVLYFHGETNLLRTSHASAVQFPWCHVTMWSVCNARAQSQCNVITISTYVIYPQYLSTIGISGKHSRLWNIQNVELLLVSCSKYFLFTQSSKSSNLKNSPQQSPFPNLSKLNLFRASPRHTSLYCTRYM